MSYKDMITQGLVLRHRRLSLCQWHWHPIWVLACILADPLPIQLVAIVPGEAGKGGSSPWDPTLPMGHEAPDHRIDSALTVSSHLKSEPM